MFFNIPPFNLNVSKQGIADKGIDQDNIDLSSSGFVETCDGKKLLSLRTSNFLILKRNSFRSPLATSRSSIKQVKKVVLLVFHVSCLVRIRATAPLSQLSQIRFRE